MVLIGHMSLAIMYVTASVISLCLWELGGYGVALKSVSLIEDCVAVAGVEELFIFEFFVPSLLGHVLLCVWINKLVALP